MGKIFSLIFVFLLVFPLTACGQSEVGGGTGTASDHAGSEPAAGEEAIVKAEFDFERKTVMLNSGYEMPINGLGTNSLYGDECINSVKSIRIIRRMM